MRARGSPVVAPSSEQFKHFDAVHGGGLRVCDLSRAALTGLILTGLCCFGVFGSSVAHSDDATRTTLSDYRKAAEKRTRTPGGKTSPRDIGPDYNDVGNKPRQFDIGVALYDANDFSGAYAIWLPLAQRDDLAAQRNVAHLLRRGKGTPQDLARALYFYERASDGGLVPAAVNAGVMHLRGEGTPAAPKTALRYLAVGVKSKHPVALYEVSLMLANGLGVTKNPKKARAYLELSARAGYKPALQKLDEVKAAELIAAQPKTHRRAPTNVSLGPPPKSKKPRQFISFPAPSSSRHKHQVTPRPQAPGDKPFAREELASGIQLVRPEQGRRFVEGGRHYKAGRYLDAADIWRHLANEGVVEAQFRLGELYFQGQGLPKDTGQAVHWLTRAAERGHRGAATLLTRAPSSSR